MCGIWAFISNKKITEFGECYNAFMKIKNRGPDYSSFDLIHPQIALGFHRLAIIDLTIEGNQPFHLTKENKYLYSVTNGEIYNYPVLKKEYNIRTRSLSDCEVILPLYTSVGIEKMCNLLGSEFATIIVEVYKNNIKVVAARDPVGVRPLFYSLDKKGLYLSSEIKSLCGITNKIKVFPPGSYLEYDMSTNNFQLNSYFNYSKYLNFSQSLKTVTIGDAYQNIRQLLINAVFSRLKSDREFGCLLSGGLDSSLVAGICRYILPDETIHAFTITFKSGGTDLPYAKKVAEHLRLKHHIIEIDEEEALKEIIPTIYSIESYDITTVRASIMQKLVAKYISSNTNIKVLLVGENSDELFGGYLYSHLAPSPDELKRDTITLVRDVHMFDGLRTDRTMSSEGLEVRLPFADVDLVNYVFNLPPEYTSPKNGVEKSLLREAFEWMNLIPKEVLWRQKEAFSDAVSEVQKSWYQILTDHINTLVTDEEFEKMKDIYIHNPPFTKESYYYRKTFETLFGNSSSNVIKYFWMPKWSTTNDPSARTLNLK
jgi:asparagine synthase (glutamine-hydrolysing)